MSRLSELDETATMADRVHGALLEFLSGGSASVKAVAGMLAVSTRTLQRRLKEGTTVEKLANALGRSTAAIVAEVIRQDLVP